MSLFFTTPIIYMPFNGFALYKMNKDNKPKVIVNKEHVSRKPFNPGKIMHIKENIKTNNKLYVKNSIQKQSNSLFLRLYMTPNKDIELLKDLPNHIELLNFIYNHIIKTFVIDYRLVTLLYSDTDNQLRIQINYNDVNVKRIFINTCTSIFNNIDFALSLSKNFETFKKSFILSRITITDDENNVFVESLNNTQFKYYTDQPISTIYDYIIVGGGPGGILASYKLATQYPNKQILLLEGSEMEHSEYTTKGYDNSSKWRDAQMDENYTEQVTTSDNVTISQGKGLGGGTLHFDLRYIDSTDIINSDFADWENYFNELHELINPYEHSYANINSNDAYNQLYKKMSRSSLLKTYNNKIYVSKDDYSKRISLGDIIVNLKNITIRYNTHISNLVILNNKVTRCLDTNGVSYNGKTFIMSSGSIHTPIILQKSGIECGNNVYDHAGIRLQFKKVVSIGNSEEEDIYENDLGFNNNKIISHIQTMEHANKWQTFYSTIPGKNDTLYVTIAQCMNIPSSGHVKLIDDKINIVMDHFGNDKQKLLTINYIKDAFIKNSTLLEEIGYKYIGQQISTKLIENNIESLHHIHGTCQIGKVVDIDHKVYGIDNLYIGDSSILNHPWGGPTSTPSAVAGMVTASKIIEAEKKSEIPTHILVCSNLDSLDENVKNVVVDTIRRWSEVIVSVPSGKPITFSFYVEELPKNTLGSTRIDQYINIQTNEVKEYNMENIVNDMMHKNLGEIIPYSGEIILSSDMWKTYAYSGKTYSRTKNYYTLLHEVGHILGIGPMWRLNGAMLYDELSQSFFYGGTNGNREYKNLFKNLDVSYMPIEDDGGPGTSNVHPEKGEHGHVSKNNRYYNGILHPGIENEIMTGWLDNNAGNISLPLSRITIGVIHDMGYDVDYTKEDIFHID